MKAENKCRITIRVLIDLIAAFILLHLRLHVQENKINAATILQALTGLAAHIYFISLHMKPHLQYNKTKHKFYCIIFFYCT